MTALADIGRAQTRASLRMWNREGMIASPVDLHIDTFGHMAIDAIRAFRARLMTMMRSRGESGAVMATRAEVDAIPSQT